VGFKCGVPVPNKYHNFGQTVYWGSIIGRMTIAIKSPPLQERPEAEECAATNLR